MPIAFGFVLQTMTLSSFCFANITTFFTTRAQKFPHIGDSVRSDRHFSWLPDNGCDDVVLSGDSPAVFFAGTIAKRMRRRIASGHCGVLCHLLFKAQDQHLNNKEMAPRKKGRYLPQGPIGLPTPLEYVCSGVVSLSSVRLICFIAESNGLESQNSLGWPTSDALSCAQCLLNMPEGFLDPGMCQKSKTLAVMASGTRWQERVVHRLWSHAVKMEIFPHPTVRPV